MKRLCLSFLPFLAFSQGIGEFSSVAPGAQEEVLVLPSTHTFQVLFQSGMQLSDGSQLGDRLDFSSYISPNGSSTRGYTTVSSETSPAKLAYFSMAFDTTAKLWNHSNSGNIDLNGMGRVSSFCSGGVMPWGTVVVAEEATSPGDINSDGYEDLGWLIEVDPIARKVVNNDGSGGGKDKIWAAGRTNHENICVASDHKTFYFGADNPTVGFLYKFVADVAQDFSSGKLFVLKKENGDVGSGQGTWVPVPNVTKEERNHTAALSEALGATNFNGVEDVEVGPDGQIYFTSKGAGRVYRFWDNESVGQPDDVLFEVFVENQAYDVDQSGPFAAESWGIGNDNMAFDGDGNLWVFQDGDQCNIWVVGPTHVAGGDNDIRLFAKTPKGSEPTGINFTPDHKYMFMSLQHPDPSNRTQLEDASGENILFMNSMTLVIARKENLGTATHPHLIPISWNALPDQDFEEVLLVPDKAYHESISVRIVDEVGRVVKTAYIHEHARYEIDINELERGYYFIQIQGENFSTVTELLKR